MKFGLVGEKRILKFYFLVANRINEAMNTVLFLVFVTDLLVTIARGMSYALKEY